jgi:bifunctional DNA-binding transcriptional regulator/antitoxin component of YhaV-PrlF toxin-antitoxin module
MEPQSFPLKIGEGRRIVLPHDVCETLHVKIGDTVIVSVENERVTLRTVEDTVARFQALMRGSVPVSTSLVDELIQDRRERSARE